VKISVITAVRNAENEIDATLASVEGQSHRDIEHIVIDGASTDSTAAIARKRNCTLVSEPDRGVYDAFNKGLAIASGDAIAFLGAGDTYCSTDTVARIVDEFAIRNVDAVFGDLVITDPGAPDRVLRRYRSSRFTPNRLPLGFMPAHPTLFLKRNVYGELGGYDISFRIAGDFELCVRAFLCRSTTYSYVDEVLVKMLSGGLSNSGLRSSWRITSEMHRACRQNAVPTNMFRLLSRLPAKFAEKLFHGD
jgi:glycosyltransferase involved in cell wall biosynthesis